MPKTTNGPLSGFGRGVPPLELSLGQQEYVVRVYSWLGVATLALFGVLHIFVEDNVLLGSLELAGSSTMLLNLLGLRFTHNAALARTCLLLSIIAMLLIMLTTGGTANTGIFWVFVLPVTAFLLTGSRQGWGWIGGFFAATTGLYLLSLTPYVHLAYSFVALRQMLAVLLVVTVGIYAYQSSRERLGYTAWQNQHALQAEKVRADTILQNINEGVVATDTEGRVVMANHAAERMLGWDAGELLGKRFVHMVPLVDKHGNIVPEQNRPLQRVLINPLHAVNTAAKLMYRRKNGSTFPAALEAQAIVVDGKVIGAIGAFRDSSEEEAIDRAKTEFVTLASHQLRTPLSAISWFGEMLLNGDAGKLNTEQRKYVEQIYQSNQRSADMVDAMLKASNLELNNMLVKPEPLDLQAIVRQVIQIQRKKLSQGKPLHITEHYQPDLRQPALDADLVETILHNLIANALKYTPKGGRIDVSISQDTTNNLTTIQVADTGYGIPKKQQAKVFTKLFRADNIKDKDTDGTGLGLYIARQSAEYLGGNLVFQSTEGQGSTFTVTLPLGANATIDNLSHKTKRE